MDFISTQSGFFYILTFYENTVSPLFIPDFTFDKVWIWKEHEHFPPTETILRQSHSESDILPHQRLLAPPAVCELGGGGWWRLSQIVFDETFVTYTHTLTLSIIFKCYSKLLPTSLRSYLFSSALYFWFWEVLYFVCVFYLSCTAFVFSAAKWIGYRKPESYI